MLTIDTLKEYGADTKEGLARCMGNETFYLRLVSIIPDEKSFEVLKDSIAKNDLGAAFEAAHALKGVTGNLALTPLYKPIYDITELLRNRSEADYSTMVDEIIEKRDQLKGLI